ncbi:MAG: polysaccharide export protein [candidate division Zixibacteria bacterium]|nr:polysaccharide export protein [candidate division Zixibacteria bacterium]
METKIRSLKAATVVLAATILCSAWNASAQNYVIGQEDLLDITFWQDPNQNTQVKVGLDGKIALNMIGQVEAAGRTTEELQNAIIRELSRLNRSISQAMVRVIEFNYNHVFVIGQVNQPGKKSFERIPDLWTVINESGGITQSGDLSRVTIIRGGDEAGKIEVVNLSAALANGQLDKLPKLRRQDTIEIGRAPGQVLGGEVGVYTEKRNIIYVIGAVGAPGEIGWANNVDVLEAQALAGGPSETADLKHTRLVIKDGNYAQTVELNLEKYVQQGRPARYIMKKEDLVIVPSSRPGFFDSRLGQIATLLTTFSTAYLVYDNIRTR